MPFEEFKHYLILYLYYILCFLNSNYFFSYANFSKNRFFLLY